MEVRALIKTGLEHNPPSHQKRNRPYKTARLIKLRLILSGLYVRDSLELPHLGPTPTLPPREITPPMGS